MIDKTAKTVALCLALVLSTSSAAQSMSRDQYKSSGDRISADYTAEFGACGFFIDNAREICQAEATGRMKVARAALDVQFKQSADARYKWHAARIDADYAVSKQRCLDKAGRERSACVDEAKAQELSAKAGARSKNKAAEADR